MLRKERTQEELLSKMDKKPPSERRQYTVGCRMDKRDIALLILWAKASYKNPPPIATMCQRVLHHFTAELIRRQDSEGMQHYSRPETISEAHSIIREYIDSHGSPSQRLESTVKSADSPTQAQEFGEFDGPSVEDIEDGEKHLRYMFFSEQSLGLTGEDE